MITITLTDDDALAYIRHQQNTKPVAEPEPVAVPEVASAPEPKPVADIAPKRKRKSRAKPMAVADLPTEQECEQAEPVPEPVAEPVAEPVPETQELDDIDGLRFRFEKLVTEDYDAAVALVDGLGVDTFQEAVGAGMVKELASALAQHA